jgi:putative colanic acid biosynthesis acetyltransferase WcaF
MQRTKYKNGLTSGNKLYRLVWKIVWVLVFQNLHGKFLNNIRVLILKGFGAKIGKGSGVYPSCEIWSPKNLRIGNNSWIGPRTIIYNVGEIVICNNVTISQYSYICAASHNYKSLKFELIYDKIYINDNVWIAADVFIGMGVEIGKNTVVGARSAVFHSFGDNNIIGGNPAKIIKQKG